MIQVQFSSITITCVLSGSVALIWWTNRTTILHLWTSKELSYCGSLVRDGSYNSFWPKECKCSKWKENQFLWPDAKICVIGHNLSTPQYCGPPHLINIWHSLRINHKSQRHNQNERTNRQENIHFIYRACEMNGWMGFTHSIHTRNGTSRCHMGWMHLLKIMWQTLQRFVFFFVKTKRRRREKRERKHAGAHNVLLQWNHWNRRKNRKLCKREVCQQKLLFFLSSLLFLCWSRFSSHTLSISSYSSICLFSEFWAWNQSQRRFQFKYTNKQTNKNQRGQSRAE